MPLFAFSQIEVPWPLGPPDGRYLVRAENAPPQAPPTHVLLFATLAEHLRVLARTLHAFRVVTSDPYNEPLARDRLLVARVGFGEGEQVAHGHWSQARELLPPAPSRRRSRILEPQSRLAGAHSRDLTESELEAVSSALARLEAVLRARAASLH